jgi:hypothetical protein
VENGKIIDQNAKAWDPKLSVPGAFNQATQRARWPPPY